MMCRFTWGRLTPEGGGPVGGGIPVVVGSSLAGDGRESDATSPEGTPGGSTPDATESCAASGASSSFARLLAGVSYCVDALDPPAELGGWSSSASKAHSSLICRTMCAPRFERAFVGTFAAACMMATRASERSDAAKGGRGWRRPAFARDGQCASRS